MVAHWVVVMWSLVALVVAGLRLLVAAHWHWHWLATRLLTAWRLAASHLTAINHWGLARRPDGPETDNADALGAWLPNHVVRRSDDHRSHRRKLGKAAHGATIALVAKLSAETGGTHGAPRVAVKQVVGLRREVVAAGLGNRPAGTTAVDRNAIERPWTGIADAGIKAAASAVSDPTVPASLTPRRRRNADAGRCRAGVFYAAAHGTAAKGIALNRRVAGMHVLHTGVVGNCHRIGGSLARLRRVAEVDLVA